MMRDRLLLLAIILFALTGIYLLVDQTYLAPARQTAVATATLQGQLADLRTRITRARQDLALEFSPSSELEALAQTGVSTADAAPQFQESARAQVVQFGGNAMSSQSVVTDLSGGYAKISVLLRARFDEVGLLAFLRAVEMAKPIILVEALEVHPLPVAGDPKPLDVTATLTEFQADAPSP